MAAVQNHLQYLRVSQGDVTAATWWGGEGGQQRAAPLHFIVV